MNNQFLTITSNQIKDFLKEQGIAASMRTVPSKKPHKLIQAWGAMPIGFKRNVLLAVHGKIDDTATQRNFNYGCVQERYIWMYQADWLKIMNYFKNLKKG